MSLLTQTQQQYYDRKKSFTGDGSTVIFTVSLFKLSYINLYKQLYVGFFIKIVYIS